MKRIRALQDKYYLDKNFFPLKDKLLQMLNNTTEFDFIRPETKENIIYDILGKLKPKWNIKKQKFY